MEWIKLFTGKWLYGSGRTMTAEKRGIWADLLALAAETKFRDGSLRFEVGQPMTKEYIAAVLRVPLDSLEAALAAFQGDVNIDDGRPRVEIMKDGTIVLNNFERYQSTPSDKKKLTGRELELWKRQQLNRLAEEYPVEAANVPAVLKVIEGSGKDNENPS